MGWMCGWTPVLHNPLVVIFPWARPLPSVSVTIYPFFIPPTYLSSPPRLSPPSSAPHTGGIPCLTPLPSSWLLPCLHTPKHRHQYLSLTSVAAQLNPPIPYLLTVLPAQGSSSPIQRTADARYPHPSPTSGMAPRLRPLEGPRQPWREERRRTGRGSEVPPP